MTLEDKGTVVAALVGKTVGFHNPQHYQEATLTSYRVVAPIKMVLAHLTYKDEAGAEQEATINATLLFTKTDTGILPIYGDAV